MQRDRRNERPRSHHRVRLRRPRRSRARLRLLLRLTGALDVPASSANIRDARGHQEAFARRHLVGPPNAERPQPTMLSSQRGPTEDEDERRDQTLLRPYGPVRVEVLLPVIPGVALIFDILVAVAAAHTAGPDNRRRTPTSKCVWVHRTGIRVWVHRGGRCVWLHRAAMMC